MRVHVNCAASLDGRIADRDGSPLRLSDDVDMARVHALRAEMDAILVGVGTVLADDPSLRVKPALVPGADPQDPVPVILDTDARTPADARVMRAGTLWFHADDVRPSQREGVEAVPVRRGPFGLDVEAVVAALAARGMESLLVEGGARVLEAFLSGPWDVFTLYQAPVVVGGGPALPGIGDAPWWPSGAPKVLGGGVLWTFSPQPL